MALRKETFYFPHDCGARNDEKIVRIQREIGLDGVAIYWFLIEMLYEAGGYLDEDYEAISFNMRLQCERISTIEKVAHNFDLFEFHDGKFTSQRVLETLKFRQEKSEKTRNSAKKRWDANAMRTQCERNANKYKYKHKDKSITNNVDDAKIVKKEYIKSAELLRDKIKENLPTFKEPSNLNAWSDEVRKMVEIDKRTIEQIDFLIKWSQNDTFWQSNILSMKTLRKQFDKLVAQVKRSTGKSKITIID